METVLQELEPWYVTGFAEGVGSFTYSRGGSTINLYFAVKLTGPDAGFMTALRDFFGGIGRVYSVRQGGFLFRVTRLEELSVVVAHFDRYPLQGAKQQGYEIWRQMVSLKGATFRRPAMERLEELAQQLSAASRNQLRARRSEGR